MTTLSLRSINPFQKFACQAAHLNRSVDLAIEKAWYFLGRRSVELSRPALFKMDIAYHAPLPEGAKLLASNHPTTIDPVMMTTLVKEQVSILISETLFKVPVLGPSLARAGHIRVVHTNGRTALEEGIRSLKDGRTVGIFPEGAISPEGGLAKAHTGAVRLAMSARVPLIPIGVAIDPRRVKRVETVVDGKVETGTWYLSGPYAITVGEALVFTGSPDDRKAVRAATDLLMQRIAELSRESAARLEMRSHVSLKAKRKPFSMRLGFSR